jgi:hypothetical protein
MAARIVLVYPSGASLNLNLNFNLYLNLNLNLNFTLMTTGKEVRLQKIWKHRRVVIIPYDHGSFRGSLLR